MGRSSPQDLPRGPTLAAMSFFADVAPSGDAAGLGIFLIVWLVVAVVAFGVWIWALVDCIRYPDQAFEAIGQPKIVWILVVIFAGVIGAIIFLVMPRPKLKAWKESGGMGGNAGPPAQQG